MNTQIYFYKTRICTLKTGIVALAMSVFSCNTLDLNPLSESATGNFYSNQTELEMAINELYRAAFYDNDDELFSDNLTDRSGGNPIIQGTINADWGAANTLWTNSYRAIGRANAYMANKERARDNVAEDVFTRLEAEARLIRAYQYARLTTHFGDIPFLANEVPLNQAYAMTRTPQDQIIAFVFEELDWAAENLPARYESGALQRFTKGAALALKARTALYMQRWEEARAASMAVMELAGQGIYALDPDYRQLFLRTAEATSKEIIMSSIRSQEFGVTNGGSAITGRTLTRNAGGTHSYLPTWELMDSYECIDGFPIDESPLYDPQDPFANRDPRLAQTLVPHGTPWLGFSYQPHPDSLTVWSYSESRMVSNQDSRSVNVFASYTGLARKKGIDMDWVTQRVDANDVILIRYAEVLLTYAEAKIELDEVDASVLNAINQVRARAYGVEADQTSAYPAVYTTDQQALRTIIKRERRVELAFEGLRYMDLIRWRIAEKALTRPILGIPDPQDQDRAKWPFPGVPAIDADGIPDYSAIISDAKILANRNFDKDKQYLWPIPATELIVNPNLGQNPNY